MRSIRANIAVLFLPYPRPEEDSRVLEELKRVYARDLIVIDQDAFRAIIEAENPPQIFRQLVLLRVNLTSVSPFVISGPASDDVFTGREKESPTNH